MNTSALYESGRAIGQRAQQLHDEASQRAHDLAERTEELRRLEQRLIAAHQRELLDTERHRIARELHDSVTQYVLSAGMAVEVCRSDAAAAGQVALGRRLDEAKELTRRAVDQLRSAIYALNHTHATDEPSGLPDLLKEVAAQHSQHLVVALRVAGQPRPLGVEAEQSLARVVGEALFNTAVHGGASRAVVRLTYGIDLVKLSVADDGHGDPAARLELTGDHDGRHRGLANMAGRVQEPEIRVVGEASTPDEALAVVTASRPDIVLVDLKLSPASDTEGLTLCTRLRSAFPDVGVLVLTTFLDGALVMSAIHAGANGYVVKDVDTSKLVRAIRVVSRGESAFDPRSAAAMVKAMNAPGPAEATRFTGREREVLQLLARGLSNRAIGQRLYISETTAKFHVGNIMRKLEVSRRAEAVYEASKMGVI